MSREAKGRIARAGTDGFGIAQQTGLLSGLRSVLASAEDAVAVGDAAAAD